MAKVYEYQVVSQAERLFERRYIANNPRPQQRFVKDETPPPPPSMADFWASPFVLIIGFILIAGLLLSAQRTGEVFAGMSLGLLGIISGVLGVIVVEGSAGVIPAFLVINKYREAKTLPQGVQGWLEAQAAAAILLGLCANVYMTLGGVDFSSNYLDLGIAVFIGGIATTSIAILSHILGTTYAQHLKTYDEEKIAWRKDVEAIKEYNRDAQHAAEYDYQEALKAWNASYNAAWVESRDEWCKTVLASVKPQNVENRPIVARAVETLVQTPPPAAFSMASISDPAVSVPTIGKVSIPMAESGHRPMGLVQSTPPSATNPSGGNPFKVGTKAAEAYQYLTTLPADAPRPTARFFEEQGICNKDTALKAINAFYTNTTSTKE